jgi:signal transduction histidine kinase
VLETIREMLETLAGPVPVDEGLAIAVQSLRRGLQAEEVALITQPPGKPARWRAFAGPLGMDTSAVSASMSGLAQTALSSTHPDGVARQLHSGRGQRVRAVAFMAAGGPTVLLASWRRVPPTKEETALLEDAAHSLRLALEREEAGHAHQEAAALRRSRELQRGFLSRLSHELRTPLTAIRGYASSLLQPDVTWDRESQQRFLDRIAAESARLGRLVDDLLDFSAIESGTMRLQWDWCDIRLVVEAAIACLPPDSAASVSLTCDPALPVVWADHDRLEQVFVNLLNNAFGHNPPGTAVRVTATAEQITAGQPAAPEQLGRHPASEVVISVLDDGVGMPPELLTSPFEAARRPRPASGTGNGNGSGRTFGNGSGHTSGNGSGAGGNGREGGRRNAGAGLGLSIAKGIVQAHGGRIEVVPLRQGTCFGVHLPVEAEMVDGGKAAGSFRGITGGDGAGDVPVGRATGRGGHVVGRDGSDTDDD